MLKDVKKIVRGFNQKDFWRVAAVYGRLVFLNRFLSPTHVGQVGLFGAVYQYPNRASLYGMFREVFIEQAYFFEATDEPISIIDCGSNIGVSLLYFRQRAPNARIVAFEPNPHTFQILAGNVLANNLHVALHNVGLGSAPGQTTFFTDAHDITSQSASMTRQLATKGRELASFSVHIEKLSDHIGGVVDVLKLDIEGAEGEVLEELEESGKLSQIKKIFIEFHHDGVHTTYPLGKLLSVLDRTGFEYVLSSGIVLPYVVPTQVQAHGISYNIVAWRSGWGEGVVR